MCGRITLKAKFGFSIEQPRESLRCPLCDSAKVVRRGEEWRTFRTLPIGGKRVTVTLPVARVECLNCEVVRQVSIAFADPRRTYTKSFARYALELLRHMTIRDVAYHLGVGWDLIKEIQKGDLQRRFKKNTPEKAAGRIAIDENLDREVRPLFDGGLGSEERRGGIRRRGQRQPGPGAVLEAFAGFSG